jgi:hypothetical protein
MGARAIADRYKSLVLSTTLTLFHNGVMTHGGIYTMLKEAECLELWDEFLAQCPEGTEPGV